ncbi:MAG: hydrolase 1, exosortase A system-associated, partial [Gemmatimonas sp.]
WGLRAGALLAAQAAARLGPRPLVLWQPPAKGAPLLQQFLRLKMAGELASGGGRGITEGLKQALARGEAVDVAGYTVPAALARGLEAATLEAATPPPGTPVAWLEVVAPSPTPSPTPSPPPAPSLLPVSESLTARWRDAAASLHAQAVPGPGFWQTTEIETTPALVEATLLATADWAAAPPSRSGGAAPAGAGKPVAAHLPGCVETPLLFTCQGQRLVGVLGTPQHSDEPGGGPGAPRPAVLIVVGGPQVRAGSHRQFVELARALAAAGHPVLRFDVRGMGDAEGEPRSFEALDDDLAAAIDALVRACPQAPGVLLWGLCDGASASLLYLRRRPDPRVKGLALANPWVR